MSNGLSFRDSWNVWRRKVNEALGSSDPIPASNISYNNTSSGLSATNVQGAIDKVNEKVASKMQYIRITSNTNFFNLMDDAQGSRIYACYAPDITDGTNTFKELLSISDYARVEIFSYSKHLAVIRIVSTDATVFVGYASAGLSTLKLMKITADGNSVVTITKTT